MRVLLAFLTVALLGSCSKVQVVSSRPESNYKFSVLQGSTTTDSTIIRVVYPGKLKVQYEVVNSNGQKLQVKILKKYSRPNSVFVVEHLQISSLSLNEIYTLKMSSNHKKWNDERIFKALDTNQKQTKILVASCMSDDFNELGNDIWPKAFAHKPDVSFLIGDNIYADTYSGIYLGSHYPATPEHLWKRHVDHAMALKVYRMKHLTPTYVTWDDHDYGMDNGDRDYKYKKESKEIFNIFFPRKNSKNLSFGPGVSTSIKLGGMNFLFLDGRTFRASSKEASGPHLGKDQRRWVMANIKPNTVNWLISGDQFFGKYHPWESFEGNHPKAFKSFVSGLKQAKGSKVFLSGDRHLVEVMKIPAERIGHETFEYTVSGVHSKMYPGSLGRDKNPLRVAGFDGVTNYGIITTELLETEKGKSVQIDFKGYSSAGLEVHTSQTLSF